jgi:endonuclease-8
VKVNDLSDEQLRAIVLAARKILQHNVEVDSPARHHTGSLDAKNRLWVYGRSGEPCRRCGTVIEYQKQGIDARGTYWCPRCQAGS